MRSRLLLYAALLLLTVAMSSCASISAIDACTSFANSEAERIVPTKPHELRCSGGESEAAYIQHKDWAFDRVYAECIARVK